MNRLAVVAVCVLAILACRRAPEAQVERNEAPQLENGNLLNLVFGAAIVDRDNELHFEASAAHAIDGTPATRWASAPGGPLTTVISLAAPTRLERLGATVPPIESKANVTLRFEASLDGKTWAKVLDLKLRPQTDDPQLGNARPLVARYLRVTLDSPAYDKAITSLHAIGRETGRAGQPPIEGCWEINGQPARFMQRGARVAGVIGNMPVDGGTDGRFFRLTWLEPPQWGFAAVTISADGQHLSGVRWHEEVNPVYTGDGWFGRRVPCTVDARVADTKIVDAIISRTTTWRLFGVRFDRQDRIVAAESASALDLAARLVREHPEHRFRIIARDFRPSPAEHCAARLAAVREALRARGTDLSRIEFVNAGAARNPVGTDFTSLRVMDTAVDFHVVPR